MIWGSRKPHFSWQTAKHIQINKRTDNDNEYYEVHGLLFFASIALLFNSVTFVLVSQFLVESGAQYYFPEDSGDETSLECRQKQENDMIDPEFCSVTPLHIAAEAENEIFLEFLLDLCDCRQES